MARLAQRQDQLERPQRETNRRVDALKRDVVSSIDSLRREIDWQSRDREWRIKSLEQSWDAALFLISLSMPVVAGIAMIIVLTIDAIESREHRQEGGEPEQRSPLSMNATPAGSGGHVQPGLIAVGIPFRQRHRHPDNHGLRSREPNAFNQPPVENGRRSSSILSDRPRPPSNLPPAPSRVRGPSLAKPSFTTRR